MNIKNKKAFFDYHIQDKYEAGLVLQGWEAKCIHGGRVNIKEAYIKIIKGEVFVVGMTVTPTSTISTHETCDPTRIKKLLLNKKEINKLIGVVGENGMTIVPIDLHLKNKKIKITIATARGKNQRDQREDQKNRDWKIEKARITKNNQR